MPIEKLISYARHVDLSDAVVVFSNRFFSDFAERRCGAITRATCRVTSTWTAPSVPRRRKFSFIEQPVMLLALMVCYGHLCSPATWPCLPIFPPYFPCNCKCYSSAPGIAATSAPVSQRCNSVDRDCANPPGGDICSPLRHFHWNYLDGRNVLDRRVRHTVENVTNENSRD